MGFIMSDMPLPGCSGEVKVYTTRGKDPRNLCKFHADLELENILLEMRRVREGSVEQILPSRSDAPQDRFYHQDHGTGFYRIYDDSKQGRQKFVGMFFFGAFSPTRPEPVSVDLMRFLLELHSKIVKQEEERLASNVADSGKLSV